MATVSALNYYPIKGCAGVTVDHAVVTETGLVHDRSFVVTDPDGTALTQRELSRLAVIRAQVLHEGTKLALSAPDAGDLMVDVRVDGPTRGVRVHRWHGRALDQGDDVAEWLAEVLGTPTRLLRVARGHHREGSGETPGVIGFADSTALTIASLSSLDELNSRILDRGAEPVPMNRFRPNIVVSGWPEPHTEDRARRLEVGTVTIAYGKRDVRCVVTMVDQLTGTRADPEPIRTLASYRRDPDGGVAFAMKAAVVKPGELAIGDEVHVTEWGESPITASGR
jgi:uncharacterized protein YcbX